MPHPDPTLTSPALRVVSEHPFNAEADLDGFQGATTPAGRHFVRSHFAVPEHPGILTIDGGIGRPLVLSIDALRDLPATTRTVTLECAGNGRSYLEPPVPGEPWALGAVGTASWTGVPLGTLLDRAGLAVEAVELRFAGADLGTVAGRPDPIAFERSLPVEMAREALVAWAMDGADLPPEHGAPVRLVMPGWYGMASVKWLTEVTALREPFRGWFQVDRYVIDGAPVREMAPRAIVVEPAAGARIPPAGAEVRGYAWSGGAAIDRVDVSLDGGVTWRAAEVGDHVDAAWQAWALGPVPMPLGPATILAVATDASGRRQPLEPVRNALGYGNHAAQPVRIEVGEGSG